MANITTTNCDLGTVILKDAKFDDVSLKFPSADTYVAGTILARKQVADAVVVAAGTNTGNGTVTLATVAAGTIIPIVGAYVLTCTAAVTHGGVFKLVDPNGAIVATDLTMTAGAGAATVFEVAGLQFTVTDAGTDFIVGDSFTLTVAADGTTVVYATAGAGGAQIPNAVLTYDVTVATGSTVSARVLVGGEVRREHLVIDAGGTVTNAIVEQLRDFGIVAQKVNELNIYDNQ